MPTETDEVYDAAEEDAGICFDDRTLVPEFAKVPNQRRTAWGDWPQTSGRRIQWIYASYSRRLQPQPRMLARGRLRNGRSSPIAVDPSKVADRHSLWQVVQDNSRDVQERAAFYAELISRGDPDVPAYLVAELPVAMDNPPWRNELIFSSEHIDVIKESDRKSLAASLLLMAQEICGAANPATSQAMWSALRRYTSLISPSSAKSLVEFLTPSDDLTTKQVVLDGVWQIFLKRPPTEAMLKDDLAPLSTRVAELASKYTDLDWLTPGDNTALALKAVQASAALLNSNLPKLTQQLAAFGKPRLIRWIAPSLKTLLFNWRGTNLPEDSMPIVLLRRSLESLLDK